MIFLAASALFAVSATAKDGNVGHGELAPLESFQDCVVCPEMIVLPLGEFLMGGRPGESRESTHYEIGNIRPVTPEAPYIAEFEGPVHGVEIDLPIAMAVNEVTFGDWAACLDDGGCGGYEPERKMLVPNVKREGATWVFAGDPTEYLFTDRHPVVDVSYDEILLYIEWLNAKVGEDVYRLPTEVEWEYAARAGTQTPFSHGYELTTEQANFGVPSTEKMLDEQRYEFTQRGFPVSVDTLDAANGWGLRHMAGNVSEITGSCWTERHPGWPKSSIHLDMIPAIQCARVWKGGNYFFPMDRARAGHRYTTRRGEKSNYRGFRLVRELRSGDPHHLLR